MDHTPGTPFSRSYNINELRDFLVELVDLVDTNFSLRVLSRIEDIRLSPKDVYNAIAQGNVTRYEVPPSRCELRLEVHGREGDMQRYVAVIYIDKGHTIFVEDVAPYKHEA